MKEKETKFRIVGDPGEWSIEAIDNNGVWVVAEPGVYFDTFELAKEALDAWSSGIDNI